MLEQASPTHVAEIDRFLAAYAETSMFLRGNLAAHGLGGSPHRHAMDVHLWREEGRITGVFGRTHGGFLMMQMPLLKTDALLAWRESLRGHVVYGFTGDAKQLNAALPVLGLDDVTWQKAEDQPLYRLDLKGLVPCADVDKLHKPGEADLPLLTEWSRGLEVDTGLSPDTAAVDKVAAARARVAVEDGNARIFIEDGQPVGMCALNARLPDIVQVGGVYVPRALRRQGIAKRMVSALMTQARSTGVSTGVLFAASTEAGRVYEGIGFRQIGAYRLNYVPEGVVL